MVPATWSIDLAARGQQRFSSHDLRRWFGHDPRKWNEFRRKYCDELKTNPDAWAVLAKAAKKRSITLVYGAKDAEHNNAVALAEFLGKK